MQIEIAERKRIKKIADIDMKKNMISAIEVIIMELVIVTSPDGIIFPTIIAIVNGEIGINGIAIIGTISTDILEENIIMIEKETSCFHSVRIPKIAQRVSVSDSIIDVPCYKCLVFVMCRPKVTDSVVSFAQNSGCPEAAEFVLGADQDSINHMREIFGLEAYP